MTTLDFPDDFTDTEPTVLLGIKAGTPDVPAKAEVGAVGLLSIAASTQAEGRDAIGVPIDVHDIMAGSYNNLDLDDAAVVYYDDVMGNVTITGFAGGYDGRRIVLYATDAGTLTLKHQDASSDAANRIVGPGELDAAITNYKGIDLVYFKSRWHVVSSY
jgi:hypothetical protein